MKDFKTVDFYLLSKRDQDYIIKLEKEYKELEAERQRLLTEHIALKALQKTGSPLHDKASDSSINVETYSSVAEDTSYKITG